MKLNDYVNDKPLEIARLAKIDETFNTYDGIMKASSEIGKMDTLGVDTLVNSWIRQQLAFREQMYEELNVLSKTIAELAGPIMHIRNEVFRKGLAFEPKFAKKCTECGKEYTKLVKKCEKCNSEELIDPDDEQLEVIKTFLDDCNIFDQSLEEVLKEVEYDVNSVDDGFLYLAKEYIEDGEDIRSKVTEIRRLRPSVVEFDLDSMGIPKNNHWVCLIHRDRDPYTSSGKCQAPGCTRDLVPTMFKYKHRGKFLYYTDSEIIHISKFSPSQTYGFPPILTVFEKALSVMGMDKTVFRYFFERKMPASMIMVPTEDPEAIRAVRAELAAQMRVNPDIVPMVGYNAKQGRARVDLIRLFHTLQEMDYLPVRVEIRERIAAIWGLPPLWQSEYASSAGGQSNQSQQLVQFSRVVESDQRLFNEKVFPFILDAFNVTDWKLILKQPEEKAEIGRIQAAQQRTAIALQLKQAGFKIEMKEGVDTVDDVDFVISGEMEQQPGAMGGFGMPTQQPEQGLEQPQELNDEREANPFGQSPEGEGQPEENTFQMARDWTSQIMKKGFSIDSVWQVTSLDNGQAQLVFKSGNSECLALFNVMGNLIDVWKKAEYMNTNPEKNRKAVSHEAMSGEAFNLSNSEDFDEDDTNTP